MLAAALAALAAAPLLFGGLGVTAFDDPGEGMHAEIARELAASRDPFTLTLNGIRYLDKPPLLYVLAALGFTAVGPSEAVARAVPAAGALAAIWATAWLGARLVGGAGGVVAGLALLTSIGFFAFSRYVRPETLFVAALAGGFALCLAGIREGRRGLCAVGLGVFGIAALAKDPLGALLPPLAVAVALVLAGRACPVGRWLPWWGVVACLVIAFGWWIGVELRTPGFSWYTAIDNHVLNVARARRFPDEDVPLSALQFLAVAIIGSAPWTLAAGVAIWSLVRRRAWRDADEIAWVALAVWAVGVIGLTALSPFRLPHYGLPASFALALLAARGWQRHGGRGLAAAHAAFFALVAVGSVLAWRSDGSWFVSSVIGTTDVASLKSSAAGLPPPVPSFDEFRPLFGANAVVFAAGTLATGLLAALANRSPRARRLVVFVVIATMVGALPSCAAALGLVAAHRAVKNLATDVGQLMAPDDLLVHEGPLENSGALEWYAMRRPVIVDGRRSVLGFGAERPEARDVFWNAARLREAWTSGRRVWVVSVRSPARSVVADLPGARLLAVTGGRALWVNELR